MKHFKKEYGFIVLLQQRNKILEKHCLLQRTTQLFELSLSFMRKKNFSILITIAFFQSYSFSQDTIRYGERIEYNSIDYPYKGKDFYSNLKSKREDIIFSKNKMRVEYCYYEDNKRLCSGNTYELLNDNIVLEDSIQWNYIKKTDDNYIIWKEDEFNAEYGQASSIFPLVKEGIFYTINNHTKDTLWQEDYSYFEKDNPNYSQPKFCYYNSFIEGKIYEYDQVDIPPSKENYTSFDKIEVVPVYTYGQPMNDITTMMCIITKEGRIVNIEQALGGLHTYYPITLKEIITQIANWGKVNPARVKGNNVNVRWFITVDNLIRETIHPIYADTPKNRKRIIN